MISARFGSARAFRRPAHINAIWPKVPKYTVENLNNNFLWCFRCYGVHRFTDYTNDFTNHSAMSFSDLPPEIIYHILSFLNIEDQNRFSMTCKKYEVYRIQMDLYEFRTQDPHEFIMRMLLRIRIPQRRITVSREPRVVASYLSGGVRKQIKCHVAMAWMTPLELDRVRLVTRWFRPTKIQPGTS